MLGSTLVRTSATSAAVVARGGRGSEGKRPVLVRCQRNGEPLPKVLKPLGRPTLLERFVDTLPLVDRTKHKLTDYCTTVEGDECCSCWDAYFELKELEEKWPAEKLNNFLQEVSYKGIQQLIRMIHHTVKLEKESDNAIAGTKREAAKRDTEPPRHVPDGLPKTQEEIEEEERALLPESDFTRLLKTLRIYPSWYRERPEVETT